MALSRFIRDFPGGGSVTGTCTAASTVTILTYAIPTDTVVLLESTIVMVYQAAAHVVGGGSLQASYTVKNVNGTVSAVTAATGSTNPLNSSTTALLALGMAADAGLLGTGTVAPTITWTVAGTNAILTMTLATGSANNVDYSCWTTVYTAGV